MTCEITIADRYRLRGVHAIEIKQSVQQILDTAKVQLPLSVVLKNTGLAERIKITDKINEGDPITLAFGYDGKNRLEFNGYIRRINYSQPIELECENKLYLLRRCYYKKSFKRVSLKELVQYVLDELFKQKGYRLELSTKVLPEMYFSNFIMNGVNGIEVLQELSDKHGIRSFLTTIDGKEVLYVGLAYMLKKAAVKYALNRNTTSDLSSLKYQVSSEPKRYRVKVSVYSKSGQNTTYEFGERDGELRTLAPRFGNLSEADVRQYANAEMEKLSTNGYQGSFRAFLTPFVEPCMIAMITDSKFPERAGSYYVSGVTTTFGVNGGRREIELSIKTSV